MLFFICLGWTIVGMLLVGCPIWVGLFAGLVMLLFTGWVDGWYQLGNRRR